MVVVFPEPRLTSRQAHLRDALVEMVLVEGFSQLTMDQVAARLNCSKRTLYALAASKEQLAVLAVRHFFRRATEQVEAAIAATRNPARRVTRYLLSKMQHWVGRPHPKSVSLIFALTRQRQERDAIKQRPFISCTRQGTILRPSDSKSDALSN